MLAEFLIKNINENKLGENLNVHKLCAKAYIYIDVMQFGLHCLYDLFYFLPCSTLQRKSTRKLKSVQGN